MSRTVSAGSCADEQRMIVEAYESGSADVLCEVIWLLRRTRDWRKALAWLEDLAETRPGT